MTNDDEMFNISNIYKDINEGGDLGDLTSLNENTEFNEFVDFLKNYDHQILHKQLSQINHIISEDEQVLEYFFKKCSEILPQDAHNFYFEAQYYEQKLRIREKKSILTTLEKAYNQKQSYLKGIENHIKKQHHDVKLFKHLNEIKNQRHSGKYINKEAQCIDSNSEIYDWIVDIDLITKVATDGWEVKFSKSFLDNSSVNIKRHVYGDRFNTNNPITRRISSNSSDIRDSQFYQDQQPKISEKDDLSTVTEQQNFVWEGAIVAVVGLYDKGKTFVLNNLSFSNLPSGKKQTTKGLSFKYVDLDEGTKLILLDTAGSYSPVKVENNYSIAEKEATEMFQLDLVFDISDYFLFVVNDFTSLDQRYLDKQNRTLQNSPNKAFREVIVIHNFKEIESQEILDHIWETQVRQIYQSGNEQQTKVAAKNPLTGKLEEKQVNWFKSPYTRHVCLVNQDSILGYNQNPWTFSLLRYWLKAVQIPLNRNFSVVDSVIHFSNNKLTSYFKQPIKLVLKDSGDELVKTIKNCRETTGPLRLPQLSIDSSGLVLTRPDSFQPHVDIIKGESTYQIYMDLPGMKKEDVTVSRMNVTTIVKGKRKKYDDEANLQEISYDKNERKFGDFTITFKIPEEYERKWSFYNLSEGVLKLTYNRDTEDCNDTSHLDFFLDTDHKNVSVSNQ